MRKTEIKRLESFLPHYQANLRNAKRRRDRAIYGTVKHAIEAQAVAYYKRDLEKLRAAIAKAKGQA